MYPEFNLNDPFTLKQEEINVPAEKQTGAFKSDVEKSAVSMILMNRVQLLKSLRRQPVWKKGCCILTDTFYCPGYRIVEDRKIRCHKVGGHGAETFVQGDTEFL